MDCGDKQWHRQSFKVGRAQPRPVYIEYLTVLLEYVDFSIFVGWAQPTFGWAWALSGPPLAMSLETRIMNFFVISFSICLIVADYLVMSLYIVN